ncbi:hypothetical protein KP509_34G003500 [Ceratopteris richardii]|uniref:RING-type domain-containing protein n=1 Tax=Ceratopteris richardii TaxID=49495 RepID=A0A8T2QHZ3_CERRI|nr:hypothetical protein KP509_34G003500 [Ceratopteris richardii]
MGDNLHLENSHVRKKDREGNSGGEVILRRGLYLINKVLENAMQNTVYGREKEMSDLVEGKSEQVEEEREEQGETLKEEEDTEEHGTQGDEGKRALGILEGPATDETEAVKRREVQVGTCEEEGKGDEDRNASSGVSETIDDESSADKGPTTAEEYIEVDLSDIRKDVQCPICLGIIRKTRTVMECLHRFCRECIDKSMRLGNNECPVCRTHCASRRSLRDDFNFDALIAALYSNVDSYEEEEFALHEDIKHQNKQLQQSIAETLDRQSDAMTRRCTTSRLAAGNVARKSQGKHRAADNQEKGKTVLNSKMDDGDYAEESEKKSVPRGVTRERRTRGRKRESTASQCEATDDEQVNIFSHHRRQKTNENDEAQGEILDGSIGRPEGLATLKRPGSRNSARFVKSSSSQVVARAAILLESLSDAAQQEKDIEFDVHLILQPFTSDDFYGELPSLEKPYLCCPASVTVQHVSEFLVHRLPLDPDEKLDLILGVNEGQDLFGDSKSSQLKQKGTHDYREGLIVPEILHPQATLGQIHDILWHYHGNLVLLYRRRI